MTPLTSAFAPNSPLPFAAISKPVSPSSSTHRQPSCLGCRHRELTPIAYFCCSRVFQIERISAAVPLLFLTFRNRSSSWRATTFKCPCSLRRASTETEEAGAGTRSITSTSTYWRSTFWGTGRCPRRAAGSPLTSCTCLPFGRCRRCRCCLLLQIDFFFLSSFGAFAALMSDA
jgi:hypothetical protein